MHPFCSTKAGRLEPGGSRVDPLFCCIKSSDRVLLNILQYSYYKIHFEMHTVTFTDRLNTDLL